MMFHPTFPVGTALLAILAMLNNATAPPFLHKVQVPDSGAFSAVYTCCSCANSVLDTPAYGTNTTHTPDEDCTVHPAWLLCDTSKPAVSALRLNKQVHLGF